LGEGLWETARLARMTPADYRAAVRVEGLDLLKASHAEGRGVILFTAHYGNWEYAQPLISLAGLPLATIARRMKNPLVDAYVNGIRGRWGGRVIHHKNAARESLRWLKSGGVLGLLFDQRIKNGGFPVPFFGRPALTTGLPALLALRMGAPLHGLRAYREGGTMVIRIDPALRFEGETTPDNMEAATATLSAVVEGWVREHPERWLWIHDRWKL
jgi:KDO2-lipid IV(A) lauroyltransferase